MAFSMAWLSGAVEDRAGQDRGYGFLAGFRQELFWCLGRRWDALFEVCDAVLCKQDRVHMVAELCLELDCRRGHGAVHDALDCGEVRIGRGSARAGLGGPACMPGTGRQRRDGRSGLART